MDESRKDGSNKQSLGRLFARVVMIVAAVTLVAAFFSPWATANGEYRAIASAMPDVMYYEPAGLTADDASELSLFEYAQAYGSMSGTGWELYMTIIYSVLGISAIALLLAALGKPIGASVFGIFTLALSRLLVWDFESRGVLPNGTHDWGVAPMIYILATIVLVAASVWLFVIKRRAKCAAKATEEEATRSL